jgi:hypothetical protein
VESSEVAEAVDEGCQIYVALNFIFSKNLRKLRAAVHVDGHRQPASINAGLCAGGPVHVDMHRQPT